MRKINQERLVGRYRFVIFPETLKTNVLSYSKRPEVGSFGQHGRDILMNCFSRKYWSAVVVFFLCFFAYSVLFWEGWDLALILQSHLV